MMFLEPETLAEYRDVRQKLLKKFAPNEDLSEAAIDSALRTAVFESVDIPKRRDRNPSVRLDHAIEKLRTFLVSPSEEYECWIEVGGLDVASLPACFGGVRFVVFDADQIQNLKKTIHTKHVIGQSEKLVFIDDQLADSLLGRPTIVSKVNARDAKAALSLAERKVRAIIECLNFFSDTVPGYHGWLFLPTNQESPSGVVRLAVADSGNMYNDYSDDRPVGGFSIAEVRESAADSAFDRVESLLEKSRNEVEELLLTAVRWAGRATVATTREEAFLLFAIALECLILPKEKDELRYRLSQRVARLCREDMDQRLELAKRTKKLYDVRSKIVHSGHYEVTEDERDEIRIAARVVILRLLTDPDVEKYGKLDKLHEYFERLTFK